MLALAHEILPAGAENIAWMDVARGTSSRTVSPRLSSRAGTGVRVQNSCRTWAGVT
eukprot:m.164203 g.164203  ORF g.164203 m.164203 type:complete len:56 (-) comp18111_c0_seq57:219-386(-)